MSYLNGSMKLAAYKVVDGRETYYIIQAYRGRAPKSIKRGRFEFTEFSIQIMNDSPICESLEKLGVNTEYPIEITGFTSNGEINNADKIEFVLGTNQAEIKSKDGHFENLYFECPRCNYPTTPKVKVQLNVQEIDKFNGGEGVEIESGEVSFKCSNRECRCQENKMYKDLILRRSIAAPALQFMSKKEGDEATMRSMRRFRIDRNGNPVAVAEEAEAMPNFEPRDFVENPFVEDPVAPNMDMQFMDVRFGEENEEQEEMLEADQPDVEQAVGDRPGAAENMIDRLINGNRRGERGDNRNFEL